MWTYPNTGDPRYKGRKTAKLYEQKKQLPHQQLVIIIKFMKKAFVSSDKLGFGYRRGCTAHALRVLYNKLCKLSSVSLFYMHAPGML